ncbi:MAG: VIT1/CCC1 transporter family protein [Bacteroidia bacterium]
MADKHHHEKHLSSSAFISDIVIGMADGLTVPFALAAGLSGAVDSNAVVITAGIAEIAAGSIAMGLGGYLAGKTEQDHYRSEWKREEDEVERLPEREKQEVIDILEEYGVTGTTSKLVAEEMSSNKTKWIEFMMRFELGLEEPHANRARNSALTIGLAYVAGGIVPLMAYMFTDSPTEGLVFSSFLTTVCLFVFGYYKSKITGQPAFSGALKVTLIGLVAAAAAFFVARGFNNFL